MQYIYIFCFKTQTHNNNTMYYMEVLKCAVFVKKLDHLVIQIGQLVMHK